MPSHAAKRLRPVEPESALTNRLIERFRALMSEGVFLPGGKLPPERALALRFGVNRTSLRHALTALEIMGIVTRRVGDGTYLSSDSSLMLKAPMDFLVVAEGISFQDLMEARIIIEPELAARAAQGADSGQLRAIREALERMENSGGVVPELVASDVAFHEAVAAASGNVTCQRMFAAIHKTLLRLITHNSQGEEYRRKADRHNQIYQAIRRRQPRVAAERMRSHLEEALEMLVCHAREQAEQARRNSMRSKLMPINR